MTHKHVDESYELYKKIVLLLAKENKSIAVTHAALATVLTSSLSGVGNDEFAIGFLERIKEDYIRTSKSNPSKQPDNK